MSNDGWNFSRLTTGLRQRHRRRKADSMVGVFQKWSQLGRVKRNGIGVKSSGGDNNLIVGVLQNRFDPFEIELALFFGPSDLSEGKQGVNSRQDADIFLLSTTDLMNLTLVT